MGEGFLLGTEAGTRRRLRPDRQTPLQGLWQTRPVYGTGTRRQGQVHRVVRWKQDMVRTIAVAWGPSH